MSQVIRPVVIRRHEPIHVHAPCSIQRKPWFSLPMSSLPACGLLYAPECIDASDELALEGATRILDLLADAVASVVERVVDAVAAVVVDGDLAVSVVVLVADPALVG